ncbi:MAG: serine/threonine-protein kinase, partial [Proteobacteria bacterium]|nr:serine/threonine-protein kinase [Pseudomonadota bacterium]
MVEPLASPPSNEYTVLRKLATGGMADIFLARTRSATGATRYVVLKQVLSHRADDVNFVNMFLDEARLAAQLQHPNIAQVFDTGKFGDSYYFTMEYVHGETVRDLLHRSFAAGEPIPIGCVLTIIAGAAAGLGHAHDRMDHEGRPLGIVHRDVSPSNLMLSYEGNVKIVDFGVAKAAHRSVETVTGTVKGKMGYMAPEQCRGGDVDPRADLFSLGIVMWELLVGDRLFKRASDFESMEAIDREPTPAPSTRRPEIPPEIDAIVLRLLRKQRLERFQSASELLETIEAAAAKLGTPLSVSALRRFLHELFGQRLEPWLEPGQQPTGELATVTGAPLLVPPRPAGEVRLHELLDLREGTPADARVAPRRSWRIVGIAVGLVGGIGVGLALTHDATPAPTHVATLLDAATASTASTASTRVDAGARDASDAHVDAGVAPDAPEAPRSPADELATAYHEGRYADALAACVGNPALATANVVTCTLAACHEHAVVAATRWYRT